MPRRMRSKKNKSKSEAKVGQMRNGTRGKLQLSLVGTLSKPRLCWSTNPFKNEKR